MNDYIRLSKIIDEFNTKNIDKGKFNRNEINFIDFLEKTQNKWKHLIIDKPKFKWHGYPVISQSYPPLGSPIEKRYLINRFLYQNDPVIQRTITVGVSYKCKCKCKQCYITDYIDKSKKELTISDFKLLFDKVTNDAKVWHIDITGGEPFEHPDFFKILEQVDKNSAVFIVATNGIYINNNTISKIKKSNIMVCKVSLDSYSKMKHDKNRAMDGAFDRVISSIRLLIKNKIFVFVQSFVERGCSKNNELEMLVKTCRDIGVEFINLLTPLMVGRLKNKKNLLLTTKDREHIYLLQKKYQINENRKRFRIAIFPDWEFESGGCIAGRGRMYINPYGDIYPCNFHNSKRYGNILKDDFRSKILDIQKNIPTKPDYCVASNINPDSINAIRNKIKDKMIKVSNSCNNKCSFCIAKNYKLDYFKTTTEIKSELSRLKGKDIIFPCNMDSRKDFFEILGYAKELGINVTLKTNARLFSYDKFALNVKPYIDKVIINKINESKTEFEKMTGVNGSYNQTMKGIKNIKKYRISYKVGVYLK